MKLEEGNTITFNGHDWLIDNVLNINDEGETCIQVRALTKKRFTTRNPDGFVGWQTALWVREDATPSPFDDYAQGEYDCLHGYDALAGRSECYYNGFADQYAAEQIATNISELGRPL